MGLDEAVRENLRFDFFAVLGFGETCFVGELKSQPEAFGGAEEARKTQIHVDGAAACAALHFAQILSGNVEQLGEFGLGESEIFDRFAESFCESVGDFGIDDFFRFIFGRVHKFELCNDFGFSRGVKKLANFWKAVARRVS